MGVNPGGTTSPGSVGTTPVDLVGRGKDEGPVGRLAARGQEATSRLLFSLGHWAGLYGPDSCLDGPWRGRHGPQHPIPAKVFWREPIQGQEGKQDSARDLP